MSRDAPLHSWIQSIHSVSLLMRCDVLSPGKFLSTFRNKLANTSSGSEIFLILSILRYETTSLFQNFEYRIPSDMALYLKVRRRGFYCGKLKTVRCRTSLCYVITAVQFPQIGSVYIAVSKDRI